MSTAIKLLNDEDVTMFHDYLMERGLVLVVEFKDIDCHCGQPWCLICKNREGGEVHESV